MKDSHYRISLDIHSTQSQVSLPVKQGDTSRKVFISLCEGGKPYHIEDDCFAVFSAKKPDGNVIENNCVIADNVIEYSITEQTSSARGILNCEIKLYSVNYGLLTSPSFTIIVDGRAVSDAEIESSSDYSALTTVYNETAAIKETIENKLENGEFDGEDVDYNLVSNALKGFASGEVVTLTDVSPLEHEMKVKAQPGARITKCGVNLIPFPYVSKSGTRDGITWTVNEDGSISAKGTATQTTVFTLAQGVDFGTVGGYGSGTDISHSMDGFVIRHCDYNPNSKEVYIYLGNGRTVDKTFYPMLNKGTAALPYEPYKKPVTFDADENGTVDGVTSLYPTTILTTDTEGVVLEVEYNRDINILTKAVPLIDRTTGIPYYLYVSGGKLLIEEREV